MPLRKLVAVVQIAFGLLGLLLCFYLYRTYVPRVEGALGELDAIAADVDVQAEVGGRMLTDWIALVNSAETTVALHVKTARAIQSSTEDVEQSLQRWQTVAKGLSNSAGGAAASLHGFAKQLPIVIPIPKVETENVEIAIPQVEIGKEQVQLPYPTAKLGTAKRRIDLGVTSVDLDVPTLQLGRGSRTLSIPTIESSQDTVRQFKIPQSVGVEKRVLLSAEKSVLDETADQLRETSIGMSEAADALEGIREVVRTKVLGSIRSAEDELVDLGNLLNKSSQQELPQIRERLARQQDSLLRTRADFQELNGLFPWFILLATLLPLGVLSQGLLNLRTPSHRAG